MAATPQTNTTLEEIARFLAGNDDFVICGHVNPDGDCIGSQLALASALRAIGKNATCLLVKDDPAPVELGFLEGIDGMVPAASFDGPARVFIGVDVPTRERVGEEAYAILDRCEGSVTIDHHAVDTTMCDLVYVDPDSASTSILVWQVVKHLMPEPPVACAECAYTGLVTDTGCFRYQNSNSAAFECASELVAAGADPAKVATNVYQNRRVASVLLEGVVIERLELLAQGRVAISHILESDMLEANAEKSDTEPLIDLLRSIRGVKVACLVKEQGTVARGSLRAKDGTDVAQIARRYGGGGHKAAAGVTFDMGVDEALGCMREDLSALYGDE